MPFLSPGLTRVLNLIVCVPFSIHGFNVIGSVLVVKLGEFRYIEELREYPVSQSLRTLQSTIRSIYLPSLPTLTNSVIKLSIILIITNY